MHRSQHEIETDAQAKYRMAGLIGNTIMWCAAVRQPSTEGER